MDKQKLIIFKIEAMKKASLIVFYVLGMIMVCSVGKSQTNIDNDKQIISMLKKFYTEYISISSETNVMSEKKLYSLEKRYCTDRLIKKIPAIVDETDADPFLKAQDAFKEDINTLSVVKSVKKPNNYIVSYGKKSKIIIEVRVIDNKGQFKIDGIK